MAFEKISNDNKYKKLTDLKVGESIVGYVTGVTQSTNPAAPGALSLTMVIGGERVNVSVAGNVKYLILDGKIQPGYNTRITRSDDRRQRKSKMKITHFEVEQDLEDSIELPAGSNMAVAAVTSQNTPSTTGEAAATALKKLKEA